MGDEKAPTFSAITGCDVQNFVLPKKWCSRSGARMTERRAASRRPCLPGSRVSFDADGHRGSPDAAFVVRKAHRRHAYYVRRPGGDHRSVCRAAGRGPDETNRDVDLAIQLVRNDWPAREPVHAVLHRAALG